jgi:hypothetical protein
MFTILVILMFIQLTVVAVLPAQEYNAEWATSRAALDSFERLRLGMQLASIPGSQFSVPIPLGTPSVSPFGSDKRGSLRFDPANATSVSLSFTYVPKLHQASVTHVDQDVILVIDNSFSMTWNDPGNLRISSAKEYMSNLVPPDRVASVDFSDKVHFTRQNVGGPIHHLNYPPNGQLMYVSPQADLDTMVANGLTDYGNGIRISNDEFALNGDPKHAWNMILLTDGINTVAGADAMALSESFRAASLGVTIYTIGLGTILNEPLLRTIAANTGGTYYHANVASEIRWVYYEISRRYLSAFVCGSKSTQDTSFGALQLTLGATRYPAQSIRMEAGAVNVVQGTTSALWRGMPLSYRETGDGVALSATFATLIGAAYTATGAGYETLQGRVIGRDLEVTTLQKAALGDSSLMITTGRQDFEYWAAQGAAKPAGVAAVSPTLNQAASYARWAQDNWTKRDFTDAKFNADRASGQLSIAVTTIASEISNGDIQMWLGNQTRDMVNLNACRLGQWANWYSGITFKIRSTNAPAWAVWFNETFRNVGAGVVTSALSGVATITIRAIDTLTLDRRLIEISFGS